MAEWSNRDVIKWLAEINMSKIAQNVRNAGLDGEKLITLTEIEVCSGLDLGTFFCHQQCWENAVFQS